MSEHVEIVDPPLVDRASAAGLWWIEAATFVSPHAGAANGGRRNRGGWTGGMARGMGRGRIFQHTRNTGIAHAHAALRSGVRVFDESIGGIGGCRFAPGPTGNTPREDLCYTLPSMGHIAPIDGAALIGIVDGVQGAVRHQVPAMLGRAGVFPPPAASA